MQFDLGGLKDRFGKKVGPLPLWVWAIIIVGVGYVGYTMVSKNRPAAADATDGNVSDFADDSDSLLGGGYSTDFPNGGSSSGGLSTGGGGSQYTASPQDLLSSQTLSTGQWTLDNPLPVSIEGVNPNLYTGTPYANAQPQQTTTAQAVTDNKAQERSRLQAELNAELAASVQANAARKAARDAANNAKTPAAKAAAAVSVTAAEQASNAHDARVGTLRAQIAALG